MYRNPYYATADPIYAFNGAHVFPHQGPLRGGDEPTCLTPPEYEAEPGVFAKVVWSPWMLIPAFGLAGLAGIVIGATAAWSLYKGRDPVFDAHNANTYQLTAQRSPGLVYPRAYFY